MGTGIDQTEGRCIKRATQEIRGHVTYLGNVSGLGKLMPLGPLDGIVRGKVEIGRIRVHIKCLRYKCIVLVFGRGDDPYILSLDSSLLDCLG